MKEDEGRQRREMEWDKERVAENRHTDTWVIGREANNRVERTDLRVQQKKKN
ncbi:hypothetical protein I79_003136 [Cricetulus griseus]|uniref:Uncharacterized protein n=1 Tax=Cricetulus griseus TaxID=10029 RepID=G3GZ57_CRIGR|nr:hypothetical protein I79_003136 [Cricetulus griseus]